MHETTASSPPSELLKRVRAILDDSDRWREQTLNLIASENLLSSAAREVLDSDMLHRYAEGHPGFRYYEGTKFIDQIESMTTEVMCRIFRSSWADVRPISGTVANEAVFSRLVPHGSPAFAHTVASGGHISHAKLGALGKRTKDLNPWPMLDDGWNIDVPAAKDKLREIKPSIAVLGRSLILFPEPVSDLAEVCHELGTVLLYDGAHVLGLIAAGRFQQPLHEGADLLCGSTHKTFFGPQRGLVLSNSDDEKMTRKVDKGVFPGSTSNHHLFTLPALLVSAFEMEVFGAAYADATIANAQALAKGMHDLGLDVAAADLGFTQSHQVAVDVAKHGGGKIVAARLCDQDIICNMNMLPGEPPAAAVDPKGLRFGVQEMTRNGMGPDEMREIAQIIRDVCVDEADVRERVHALRARFTDVKYGFTPDDLR
ncbi:MAG: serine hydroxymethyltransferase [Planctomycetota bacterium]|nr:serine hydroxymethyltransferase [Planctomycetota bacterium]